MTYAHARKRTGKARKMNEKCTCAFSLRPCSTQRLPWRPHCSMNNAAHTEAARLEELGYDA
jgi:hypothetical protein